MNYQIIITGFGGQGVLFISRLLAEAMMENGFSVFTSETHGMAQRGGSVISHLKMGDFASPMIKAKKADALISLKKETFLQYSYFSKENSAAFVNANYKPDADSNINIYHFDADRAASENEKIVRSVNIAMLGFFCSYFEKNFGPVLSEPIKNNITNRLKSKEALLNTALKIFDAGYNGRSGIAELNEILPDKSRYKK